MKQFSVRYGNTETHIFAEQVTFSGDLVVLRRDGDTVAVLRDFDVLQVVDEDCDAPGGFQVDRSGHALV